MNKKDICPVTKGEHIPENKGIVKNIWEVLIGDMSIKCVCGKDITETHHGPVSLGE